MIVNEKAVKRIAKEHKMRVSKGFVSIIDRVITDKIQRAIGRMGSRRTLQVRDWYMS